MDLKIFTNDIEDVAKAQVEALAQLDAFKDAKVRIMPDVHCGKGCVIGFTADLGKKVIPNIVGVDIGCGMRVIYLGELDINFQKLDKIIHDLIPAGMNVHNDINMSIYDEYINELYCASQLLNTDHIAASMGTLGGGWQ